MSDRREEALMHRELAAAYRKEPILVRFAEAHERQADALESAEPLDFLSVRAMDDGVAYADD